MIIKNHKDVYKIVAENLNLDYETIRLIGDCAYEELGKKMDAFENRENYMFGLGCFRFRKKRSLQYIEKSKKTRFLLKNINKSEEQIVVAEEKVKEKIRKLQILIDEWDVLANARREFKQRKLEYVNRNLQESQINMGGSKEPNI